MPYSISPAVLVTEQDLTNVVPAVATTAGAFAGAFQWGPALEVRTMTSEKELAETFFKPNNDTAVSFFSAANFLAYGNNLQVVRVVGDTARNAVASGTAVKINNEDDYLNNYASGEASVGPWAAKYPGVLGNSLKVSLVDAGSYYGVGTGDITTSISSATVTGDSTLFTTEVTVGSTLKTSAGVIIGVVASIASDTSLTLTGNAAVALTDATFKVEWEYAGLFNSAPSTSDYAASVGGSSDELHIVVIDEDGALSGTQGTILETFAFASKASDAKNSDGTSAYYKEVINRQSQYIWWMDHITSGSDWGTSAVNNAFVNIALTAGTVSLTGGVSSDAPTDGEIIEGYMLYANDEVYDVSLIVSGGVSNTVKNALISNIAEARKDCVVYVSPNLGEVVNNVGQEATDIVNNKVNISSSYGFMDSGWKYQYDRYNDVYRWIPLNGDTAGLSARTDATNDPWWSPAGYTRGQIKNVVKLAWSPNKAERDALYKANVNPVVSFRGQGTILFGDKTMLAKPSAFDRINVRRLFIVLEKAIATAAKYQLFEFNDVFSRAQFRNLVEPFLRDVKGRRGVTEFKVVCDETNNTPQVIAANEFVGEIYLVPNYSTNVVKLGFIASKAGLQFTTTGG
jgi:hypothetical protein